MTIRKLSAMPYAQAHVEIDRDGNIFLISYVTLVCCIDNEGWLSCTGTYSNTTRRHIGAFMREYVKFPNGEPGNYYMAKDCFVNNYEFNINTGEVKDLP